MKFIKSALIVVFFIVGNCAHASIFSDDEARQAIINLRNKVDSIQTEVKDKIQNKADSSSILSLSNQNAQIQQQLDDLRGKIEVLSNSLATLQKNQTDTLTNFDTRLRKLEPQAVTIDGATATVTQNEEAAYNTALGTFKNGDYKGAAQAFSALLKLYPTSAYAASAQYWIGNAYYAQGDYKHAISAQQLVVKNWPNSPKSADALLSIATCQTELNERVAARKTLNTLISQHPNSSAAKAAKDRLAGLK